MNKVAIGLVSVMLATSVLAGCSTSGSSGSGSSGKGTTLTWWVDSRPDLQQTYKDIAQSFEKQYPNVHINMIVTPDSHISQRISIAANTGQLPDVEQGSFFWPLSYANKNLLLPLDDIVNTQQVSPSVLKSVSVNNHVYIYPNSAVDIGLLVNMDLFKKAGATNLLPKNMGTWSDSQFVQAAKAVTDAKDGVYGYGLYAGDTGGDQGTEAMLWGFGAQTFSSDDKQAVLNSPQAVKGLNFLISLEDDNVVPPGAASLTASQEQTNLFLQGKLGMMFGNIANISIDQVAFKSGQAKPFTIGFVPFPSESGQTTNTVLFGYGTWAWNTGNTQNEKWAKKFVQFVNNEQNLAAMAADPSVVPTDPSLASGYTTGSLKWDTIQLFQYAGNVGAGVPGYAETRNAFYPQIQAALLKQKTAQQALDDWVQQANQIIQQNSGT